MYLNIAKKTIKKEWPLFVALAIFFLTIAIIFFICTGMTGGKLIYALDDAYIHMSMAKNLSQHGVWGVTQYEFSSSSSSPLWLLILTLSYVFFGVNEWSPLVLNILFSIAIIVTVNQLLKKYVQNKAILCLSIIFLIFVTPLPTLVFSGMEHVMQIFIILLFVWFSILIIVQQKPIRLMDILLQSGVACLAIFARYESIFLVLMICFILFLRKKYKYSFLFGLLSVFPLLLLGYVFTLYGSFFLPNSIILKGLSPNLYQASFNNWYLNIIYRFIYLKPILFLFVFNLYFFVKKNRNRLIHFQDFDSIFSFIFLSSTLFHLQFADIYYLYRYEAYLVILGCIIAIINSYSIFPNIIRNLINKFHHNQIIRYWMILAIIFLFLSPLLFRCAFALYITPLASNDIYRQQYQMAKFLQRYYFHSKVAANDIGAITYFTNIQIVDFVGLANISITKKHLRDFFNTQDIIDIVSQERPDIAVIYDSWLERCFRLPFDSNYPKNCQIPNDWKKIVKWEIEGISVILGGRTVSFYQFDTINSDLFIQNIKSFSNTLPSNVLSHF